MSSRVLDKALSLESKDRFRGSKLFIELTEAISEIRKREIGIKALNDPKAANEELKDIALPDIIKRHTNLHNTIIFDTKNLFNATALVTIVDKNHPLLKDVINPDLVNITNLHERLKKISEDGVISGSVDIKRGWVDGIFAEIESPIFISANLMSKTKSKQFTDEEIAAIFCHEIGHFMTFYEYLGSATTSVATLNDLMVTYNKADTKKKRIEVLNVVEDYMGISEDDIDALSNNDSGEAVAEVLMANYVLSVKSISNSELYDVISAEQLADNYATQQGAGKDLVTALDKMMKLNGGGNNFFDKMMIVLGMVLLIVFTLGLVGILFVFEFISMITEALKGNLTRVYKNYDDPKERFIRVKEAYINQLKDFDLDDGITRKIIKDLEEIEKIINETADEEFEFHEKVFYKFSKKYRKQLDVKAMMKDYESLANNSLFVSSAKFRTVSKT